MPSNSRPEVAFHFIVQVFESLGIPFLVVGGLAARVYGSVRPLNDIDLAVPDDALPRILERVQSYVVFGPARYENARLSLMLLTLEVEGHVVDIAGITHGRILDRADQRWVPLHADFAVFTRSEVFGRFVPVVTRSVLLDYKRRLDRHVDRLDVAALRATSAAGSFDD